MAPVRLVSHRQLELIVEFAEQNKNIVLNSYDDGPLDQSGHQKVNKAWGELANKLNSVDEGTTKTPEKWKRYWHLLKHRTKAKAANIRRNQAIPGGVPNKMAPLSDLEGRIVSVVGKVDVERVCKVGTQLKHYYSAAAALGEFANKMNSVDEGTARTPEKRKRHSVSATETSQHGATNCMDRDGDAPDASCISPLEEHNYTGQFLEVTYKHEDCDDDSQNSEIQENKPVQAAVSNDARAATLPLQDQDDKVLRWATAVEERRVAAEERLANALVSMAATNKQLLRCFQGMEATQAQLVGLLQKSFNPP